MAFEMATYGAIAGLLYRKLPKTGWRIYARSSPRWSRAALCGGL
ncbi:MAG: hypothetical protein ACLRSD_04035 [Oscillibacter sp.]